MDNYIFYLIKAPLVGVFTSLFCVIVIFYTVYFLKVFNIKPAHLKYANPKYFNPCNEIQNGDRFLGRFYLNKFLNFYNKKVDKDKFDLLKSTNRYIEANDNTKNYLFRSYCYRDLTTKEKIIKNIKVYFIFTFVGIIIISLNSLMMDLIDTINFPDWLMVTDPDDGTESPPLILFYYLITLAIIIFYYLLDFIFSFMVHDIFSQDMENQLNQEKENSIEKR